MPRVGSFCGNLKDIISLLQLKTLRVKFIAFFPQQFQPTQIEWRTQWNKFKQVVQSILETKAADDTLISRSPLLQLVDEHSGVWSHAVPPTGGRFPKLPAIPIVFVMRSVTDNNGHYVGTNEFLQKTSQWVTSCIPVNYCARDLPRIAVVSESTWLDLIQFYSWCKKRLWILWPLMCMRINHHRWLCQLGVYTFCI